jgi:sugar phosphate isomerase/epimerase
MIAFSTCWNSGRHTSGEEMLREIQALGFDLIELGHGIRISLMPGIQKMFDAGEVRISSLHNFCPLPVEIMDASPDCYEFSTARKSERDRAVKQTLQTLDFAARLNAPFVVLHCGSISMNPITDELIALVQNGGLLSRKYVRKKIDAVRTREQAAPAHLARVKECLKPIIERAAEKNVRLGIEGRRGYEEIPSEREIPGLLEGNRRATRRLLARYGSYSKSRKILVFSIMSNGLERSLHVRLAVTCRIVKWPGQDHQPPFLGDMRLEPLTRMLPQNCQIVWELSPRLSAEEIMQSERFGKNVSANEKDPSHPFQIAVTVGMLIWVFHDPNQRAKMAEALRTADYRWVGAGILAYIWWKFLRRFAGRFCCACKKSGSVFPASPDCFLSACFTISFCPAEPAAILSRAIFCLKRRRIKSGRFARGSLRPAHRFGRARRHYRHPRQSAVRYIVEKSRDAALTLDFVISPGQLDHGPPHQLHHQRVQPLSLAAAQVSRPRKIN